MIRFTEAALLELVDFKDNYYRELMKEKMEKAEGAEAPKTKGAVFTAARSLLNRRGNHLCLLMHLCT